MKIDIHTHILPKHLPRFKEKFGYGGFINIEHKTNCMAHMMVDDGTFFREIKANCWDPAVRMKECDEHDVRVQVLSTVPVMFSYWAKPKDGLTISQYINDDIAETVNKYPTRFMGLANLPMQDADLAIRELERAMKNGLRGAQIGSNVNEANLSDPRLFPVFEAASELGAAIFIHPWDMNGGARMNDYWLAWLVGMPSETALAICHLIFGGVFERLPKLRVAFAHGGGAFPGTIGRIEHGFRVRPDLCALNNNVNPTSYLGRFFLDSLVHDQRILRYLIDLIGEDKVLLGSDYPFPLGEHRPGELINSMNDVSQAGKAKMLYKNALTWLGMAEHDIQK